MFRFLGCQLVQDSIVKCVDPRATVVDCEVNLKLLKLYALFRFGRY